MHVATFRDPLGEQEKLHELYDALMEARRQSGEEVVPFHRFADLVKEQVQRLRAGAPNARTGRVGVETGTERRGAGDVTFRVMRVNGRVNLTVRRSASADA